MHYLHCQSLVITASSSIVMSFLKELNLRIRLSKEAISLTATSTGHLVGTLAHRQGGQEKKGENLAKMKIIILTLLTVSPSNICCFYTMCLLSLPIPSFLRTNCIWRKAAWRCFVISQLPSAPALTHPPSPVSCLSFYVTFLWAGLHSHVFYCLLMYHYHISNSLSKTKK